MVKVNSGANLIKEENVILGKAGRTDGPVTLGDNATLRIGTVIYADVQAGNNFQTGVYATIREHNQIGDNCAIGAYTYLGPENKIGNNVKIHTNCFLEMATIEDEVAFGPHVVTTDDLHPRCPRFEECVGGVKIKKGAKIGANVTILPGVTIGQRSLVSAGSVVTKNVPPGVVVVGNPAKVVMKIEELKCPPGYFKRPYEWEVDK